MESAINRWSSQDREALATFIGESPETVIAIHALRSGRGRVWVSGTPRDPRALIIEPEWLPGEPLGFGDDTDLLELLAHVDGWDCFELTAPTAERVADEFARRWGIAKRVVDVHHVSEVTASVEPHPLEVRPLRTPDLDRLAVAADDIFPARDVMEPAVELGRVFVAIDGELIVGQGSSFAAGERYADVGVHVAETHRRRGLATGCAARVCEAVRTAGLTPVWSCGAENRASLRVAAKLGFVEVTRLVFLVPHRPQS
jgi:RimJ/RimL family protein N-acetyltransferase